MADPDGRVRLEGDIAAVRRVAGPIQALRPPRGLRPEVEDLIILAWAELQQRAWFQHGSPMQPPPRPGQVRAGMELRPEPLPQPEEWKVAISRVEQIFGAHINPYLTASGVTELAETLGQGTAERADVTARLSGAIESAYRHLGMLADKAGRLSTAKALADLAESLRRAPDRLSRIRALALATFPATEAALAKSLSQAVRVSTALGAFHWERLSPLRAAAGHDDERGRAAKATAWRRATPSRSSAASWSARRITESLRTASYPPSAFRPVLDSWLLTLQSDAAAAADPSLAHADHAAVQAAAATLLDRRLEAVARQTPAFAQAPRAYDAALIRQDPATADSFAAWIGGQPNAAAAARRAAGIRGDLDHFGAMGFLQGLLVGRCVR